VVVPFEVATVVRDACTADRPGPTGEQDLQLAQQLPQGQADTAGLGVVAWPNHLL